MGVTPKDLGRRWPGATVPIDVKNAPHTQDAINQAIAFFEKFTPFRFVPRTSEDDFIAFTETNTRDPASGAPLVQGNWKSVREGHELVPIGGDPRAILDWVPATGETRVWTFDPAASEDPLPDPPLLQHTWQSIRRGHVLTYVGSNLLLDWTPSDASFRIWQIDRDARGSDNLLVTGTGSPIASGTFATIDTLHELIPIGGGGSMLDWVPLTGKFRIFHIDPKLAGGVLFDENKPLFTGSWGTIRFPLKVIPLGSTKVLDWNPITNHVRIWHFDLNEKGADPLPAPVLFDGTWSWLKPTNVLVPLGNRILIWDPPTGDFALRFIDLGSSHSDQVGRRGGRREIFANTGVGVGTMLHEIGHALGLFHEQERPDRDQFVTVNKDNIADPLEGNFAKLSEGEVIMPTSYDYGSMMHYGGTGFSINGGRTLMAPGGFDLVIGLGSMPSVRDLATLNLIADPLPGGPRTQGTWQSIRKGHELVAVSADHVLDWQPETGAFRLWKWDRHARGAADPLPGDPLTSGTWGSIRAGHQLIAIGDFVLDWMPFTGDFRLWKLELSARGAQDPLPGPAVQRGTWTTIRADHHLVDLGGGRVLDWDNAGKFRVWRFDPTHRDVLVDPPLTSGQWKTINGGTGLGWLGDGNFPYVGPFSELIDGGHELVRLGDGNVLDRHGAEYRIWRQDGDAHGTEDPLPGWGLACGTWTTIDGNHRLIPVGPDQVLDWEPGSGAFRVWHYGARFGAYRPDPLPGSPLWRGTRAELTDGHGVTALDGGHVLTWDGGTGAFDVWAIDPSVPHGADALRKLKSGTFDVGNGHQLVDVGGHRLLDFHTETGRVRVFDYDLSPGGGMLLQKQITDHTWASLRDGHRLLSLGGGRVLDWTPTKDSCKFRVWTYDPSATGTKDPLIGPASAGAWESIKIGHALVAIDTGHVIDWIPDAGWYRVYQQDLAAKGDFLPGLTLVEGFWQTIGKDHRMIGVTGARALVWNGVTGEYRIYGFAVPPARP